MGIAVFFEYIDGSFSRSYQESISRGDSRTFSKSGYNCTLTAIALGSWEYTISGNTITFTKVDSTYACSVVISYTSVSTYTVTLDPGEGTVSPSSYSGASGTVITLPTPTLADHSFNGWYTAASGGTRVGGGGDSYTITATTTLYAQWTQTTFTVTFDPNGGTVSPVSVRGSYGATITLPTPYLLDKSCIGWYTAISGGTKVGDIGDTYTITSTITLYAHWVNYSGPSTAIFLIYKGSTFVSQDVHNNVYGGSKISKSITGYSITSVTDTGESGWSYSRSGNAITFLSVGEQTLTLFVVFDANTIQVNYNGNGSTSGSMSTSTFTYDVAQALSQNAFTRSYRVEFDYNGGSGSPEYLDATASFDNWNSASGGTGTYTYSDGQTITNPCGSTGDAVTLYAQWNLASITLPTPTKEHSIFSGWYDSESGGTKIGDAGDTYTPTAGITLYAHWADDYLITYDANRGTVSPASEYCHQGDSVTLPTPTREKSDFLGWYNSKTEGTKIGDAGDSYTPSASITLYAHWYSLEIIVMFDATGGNISSGTYFKRVYQRETYGELPTPTKSGYIFDGWFTMEEGGVKITSSTTVTTTEDQTLYAQWTKIPETRTLTYNPTGGSVSPSSSSVIVGQQIGTLPTPTMANYTFDGWYNDTIGTTQITPSYVMPQENITIYAKWTGMTIVVTFDANGGTASESTRNVIYGNQILRLPTATKTGKKLVGWFDSDGVQIDSSYVPTENVTLYAVWDDTEMAEWFVFEID